MLSTHFCPECFEYTECESIIIEREFDIKGEQITINAHHLKCQQCGNVIPHPEYEQNNYDKAYNKYRSLKNLLQPEEIKEIREKYGVSQRQLAKILGWSHATLSRYESGALQGTSHNNELVLLRDPDNMLEILERNASNLSQREFQKIKKAIVETVEQNRVNKICFVLENLFIKEPNEFTGYKKFDLDKFVQTVKYFALRDHQMFKVKLMKYLWYSDFLHFKRHTVSINGLQYARLPKGPVPDQYEYLTSLLLSKNEHVQQEFVDFGSERTGEKFIAVGDVDKSLFTEEELQTLQDVYHALKHHNSTSVSEYSHQELGWVETDHSALISYNYAENLSLN